MEKITQSQVELVVSKMAETAISNEAYFSELDAVMGDGDFGVSLQRFHCGQKSMG